MRFTKVEFEQAFGLLSQIPPSDIPEIAVSGRSNVGKSSLINRLCGRKNLARVSSTPGKTGTINFYREGDARIVDLPGYGYAKVSKTEKERWRELVDGYLRAERDLRLVVQLVDIRHPPSQDDLVMLNFLIDAEYPFIVVFTKKDKLSARQYEERMAAFRGEIPCYDEITSLAVSAEKGYGIEELRGILCEVLE